MPKTNYEYAKFYWGSPMAIKLPPNFKVMLNFGRTLGCTVQLESAMYSLHKEAFGISSAVQMAELTVWAIKW